MAHKIHSFREGSMCVKNNGYSPVLLIILLKHIFLLKKYIEKWGKGKEYSEHLSISSQFSTQQGSAKGVVRWE